MTHRKPKLTCFALLGTVQREVGRLTPNPLDSGEGEGPDLGLRLEMVKGGGRRVPGAMQGTLATGQGRWRREVG